MSSNTIDQHSPPSNTAVCSIGPVDNNFHPTVNVVLSHGSSRIRTTALIDSGAPATYIDRNFANSHNFSLSPIDEPIQPTALDGRPIGSTLIDSTTSVSLTIDSYSETLDLYIVDSPQFPVVLGYSWLRTHNPTFDWENDSIDFNSTFCLNACCTLSSNDNLEPELTLDTFIPSDAPSPEIPVTFLNSLFVSPVALPVSTTSSSID